MFEYIAMRCNPLCKHANNGLLPSVEFERQQKTKSQGVWKIQGHLNAVGQDQQPLANRLMACVDILKYAEVQVQVLGKKNLDDEALGQIESISRLSLRPGHRLRQHLQG